MRYQNNHYIYFLKNKNGKYVLFLLYVDDILVLGSCMEDIIDLNKKLGNNFSMKDFCEAKIILGIRIIRNKDKYMLKLFQEKKGIRVHD